MPRPPRICPGCTQPIRQREHTITLAGVRHHLECARSAGLTPRGRGRPPKPVGQRVRDAKPLYLRLTVEARASLDAAAQARGMSTEDYARLLLIPQFRGP